MASPNSLLCYQASTVANPSCVIPERTDFFSSAPLMDRSHNSQHQEFLFFESPINAPNEVGAFYWTALAPDIVNPGREERVSIQL